jgi:hypothetical protein
MLPIDLRPEENNPEVWLTLHASDDVFYTTRVSADKMPDEDIKLLCDSLEFLLNKFGQAIDYIHSKGNNL